MLSISNNNTFTWSGHSGVIGFTGQQPVGPRGVVKHPKGVMLTLYH
jgi:hypothetical protein